MPVSGLIGLLIVILIVALVAGLVVFLIRRAPMIEEPFKSWAEYVVLVIAVIIIVVRALALIGVSI
jgi:hypothetical protein